MKLQAVLPACLASFLLALIGYLVYPSFAADSFSAQQSFALGLLVSGLLVPVVLSKLPSATTKQTSADPSADTLELTTLYVGNLPYSANEVAVRELFGQFGRVFSVRLMKDRETGRRRGFGFIEMLDSDARKAISQLNESNYQERTLKVREANQRKNHEPANQAA